MYNVEVKVDLGKLKQFIDTLDDRVKNGVIQGNLQASRYVAGVLKENTPNNKLRKEKGYYGRKSDERAADNIVNYADANGFAVGWSKEDIAKYMKLVNEGTTSGWQIKADKKKFLFFPVDETEKTGFPTMTIGDTDYYYLPLVHHPAMKPVKFLEKTIVDVSDSLDNIYLNCIGALL